VKPHRIDLGETTVAVRPVGELPDYIVRGHSEWLLRKSIAPLADWTTSRGAR
jgi:hypothetical protein